MDYALIFGYWLVGLVIVGLVARKVNNGLSIIDMLACVVAALWWPLVLVIVFVWAVCYKAPWLYEARFFKPRA